MMKQQCIVVICLLALILGFTSCNEKRLQETDVDAAFEQDYVVINDITQYLLSLEETPVYIDCEKIELKGRFGVSMEFQSQEIEKLVRQLKNKGYNRITKKDSVVFFDIWGKRFDEEFESGVVYSVDGTGILSTIQFLVYQRPLPKENWYYYESDYNEWRSKQ